MAVQTLTVPDGREISDHDWTQTGEFQVTEGVFQTSSFDSGAENRISDVEIHHLLARVADSDRYRVALVSSPKEATNRDSSSLTAAMPAQILFLPLSWKDILGLITPADRSSGSLPQTDGVRFGEVFVDFYRMQVTRRGKPVALTALEFKVLRFMVQNPERAISRDELLNQVWGYNNYPVTRTVDNHVCRPRQKLETDPVHPLHFRTINRVGYKFVP